jgi:Tfp pilus assembly protein PilW
MLSCPLYAKRLAPDSGMTLAELLVAMGLSLVLGTMATTFFVSALHATNRALLTNQDTADARVTLDDWTAKLRAAGWLDPNTQTDRFEEITPTKIVFYANLTNRATADSTLSKPTKVALLVQPSDTPTGEGELVEILFKTSDNTTPESVRQLAFHAGPTGGVGQPVFQPYNKAGGLVSLPSDGCLNGSTPVSGLCLQSAQPGAGMQDPSPSISLTVSPGPLRGNPGNNVDPTMALIGSIKVAFTVSDPSHTTSMDFSSLVAVTSGYPS